MPRPSAKGWPAALRARLGRAPGPARIQDWLDSIPYSSDPFARCPRRVLEDGRAHCWDGALLAAAALRAAGEPPLVVDLRAVRDDDHVLAVFRRDGLWGAVAKSNFAGLRWREPVHRTLRELALSYFEEYFNTEGEKTLRSYSGAFDLSRFDAWAWETSDERLEDVSGRLDAARHFELLPARAAARLRPVDGRMYRAGLLGVNEAGLYRPAPRAQR